MGFFTSDKKDKLLWTAVRACEHRDAEKLRRAIADGADVNGRTKVGTPLEMAVRKDFTDGIRILLENKADPELTYKDNRSTSLMEAVSNSYYDAAKLLLEHGAKVNATRTDGQTALHLAGYHGRGDLAKLLLANGADPNIADNRMNTPYDAANGRYSRVAELIHSHQKKPEAPKPAPVEPVLGWQLTARDEVSNIVERPGIGYRLMEIFNFGSGTYTRIAQNLETGAESQSLRFFDEFADRSSIDRAEAALVRLGGDPPSGKLAKPTLPARPHGGQP